MSDEKLWNALNQPGIVKLQDMLESTRCIGIVNLSEAIEELPLTEPTIQDLEDKWRGALAPKVDEDAERAAFEAWIGGEESLEIVEGDIRFACTGTREWHYRDYPTELAFCAVLWRASRG